MVPIQTHPLTGKSPAIIYKNLENGFKAFVLARRIIDSGKKILAVCANEDTAAKLSRDLKFFLGHPEQVIEFNASPHIPYDHLSPSHLSETNLLQKMFHLRESFDYKAITCSLGSLLQRWVPIELLDKYSLNLKADQEVNRPKLLEHFALTGFRKTELVEDPGCFAVRGFILDIYSPNYRLPLRLEFFDEFLDSIKFFDPQSQRTFGTSLKEVKIIPARQIIFDKETLSSFREKILPLADQEHYPSHKTAALLEQLSSHLYFIGLERYLPAFYPQMKSLLHYLPSQETEIFLDDPETLGAEYE